MTRSVLLRLGLSGFMALLLMASAVLSAGAADVTVTATNSAALQITLSDSSADFGTGLDPVGTNATSTDTVADFQGTTGDEGSYYVWKSSGSGMTLTVKSNKTWTGLIKASENPVGGGASASLTVASEALLYGGTYGGALPTSYATASSLAPITTSDVSFLGVSPHAKGVSVDTFYYALRIDWDDDPGTFTSTVTYTISQ